ncbi:MAG: 5-bromo-4-chloroindolyl phosphate hydrolysis family protein [Oscillospiraceae bacterium]|nr:5-bromo-4-chloroindolyl phosphate hydrolysis family protein [Oscillospiraceae bacterium]
MADKNKSKLWPAIFAGVFVGAWVLAGVMGWSLALKILTVLTAAGAAAGLVALIIKGRQSRKAKKLEREARKQEQQRPTTVTAAQKKSYGPEVDPIIQEGNRALSEMGRLYMSIKDVEVRKKINELMRITDKITQDAIEDPSDIPQIRKFMNYYLPTTIKLLNAYDRMSAQGIEGENLDKSMANINEMLDAAIVAYKKRLDSLFENQALDIETDIEVMNTMLAREGLSGNKDFDI